MQWIQGYNPLGNLGLSALVAAVPLTEEAAMHYFEQIRWPSGPYCPHWGNADRVRSF
ncbi:MAG: transposase [Desulfobaccales bacterium]